jgi:hypothetical protein
MGVSMYRDHPMAGDMEIGQTIFATHVAYISGRNEFLNETIWMQHRSTASRVRPLLFQASTRNSAVVSASSGRTYATNTPTPRCATPLSS